MDFGGGYQANQFDDQFSGSQFGGGGFVNNDGGGMNPTFSQSQSPNTVKKRDEQTLTPVTIKQLLECEARESKFRIDGKDISQVTFVGLILTCEVQMTNLDYLIDDGTAKINVKIYVDMDESEGGNQKQNEWREGSYVRVVGNLRNFSNQKSVVGFNLIPILDFNEITFHNLEVIATHLRNTKGEIGGDGATPAVGGQSFSQPNFSQAGNNNAPMGGNVNMGGGGGGGGGGDDLQTMVLRVFASDNSSDTGTSVDTVCQRLQKFSPADIRKVIDHLSEEGHLYSTIDEDHYKSTENC